MKASRRQWNQLRLLQHVRLTIGFICLTLLGISLLVPAPFGNLLAASSQITLLTIPCGIPMINQKRWLWILRQATFGTLAAFNIVQALGVKL